MLKEALIARLKNKANGITIEELLNQRYPTLLQCGLRVVTLCNDGSGRSRTVADELNKRGIPAVRIIGGIREITNNTDLERASGHIRSLIAECPTAAVILTHMEMLHYIGFLSNLRAFRYNSSASAIDSITNMEKG